LKNKLWGLIACHHNSPLNQPQSVRGACQLFAQSLSLKLLGLHENAVVASQLVTLQVVDDLITHVRSGDGDLVQALVTVQQAMMDLFEASSFARVLEDEVTTFGDAPQSNAIRECVAMLRQSGKRALFAVDNRDLHPLKLPESASGFFAIQIGLIADEWLIFFRPSQVQLVNWAGNPGKAVEIIDGELRLHPRRSFALWTQEVRDQSKPWTETQIQVAEFLQSKLLSIRKEIINIDIKIQQESAQQKVDFVASIAHDLKNPVLGTLKVLELLKTGRMGKTISEVADILQQVIESQEVLLARIKSITLGYQHADGSPRLTLVRASLRTVLEKSIKLSEKCTKTGQKFLVELGADDLIISGDEDALSRVFENLLFNAINYSPLHGQISITAESSEGVFEVRIVDNGVGITRKDLPKIFQRFWRGEQRSNSNSGNGLGLYICKKIIEGHGGSIECSSEVGVGTTFTVKLPCLKEEEEPIPD
jgi:chemotaxis family two-component system sensor kinase Cph1